MSEDPIRKKIRKRLDDGTLPREVPLLTKRGLEQPGTPLAHMRADSAIGLTRCSGCDAEGAQVTYRYADGAIIRFHSRCHRIWEEECQRPRPEPEHKQRRSPSRPRTEARRRRR